MCSKPIHNRSGQVVATITIAKGFSEPDVLDALLPSLDQRSVHTRAIGNKHAITRIEFGSSPNPTKQRVGDYIASIFGSQKSTQPIAARARQYDDFSFTDPLVEIIYMTRGSANVFARPDDERLPTDEKFWGSGKNNTVIWVLHEEGIPFRGDGPPKEPALEKEFDAVQQCTQPFLDTVFEAMNHMAQWEASESDGDLDTSATYIVEPTSRTQTK